jgi:choline dehydrogenase
MRDLIIIGAGTAGCVLADRLTRSGRLNVVLVEAGGPPSSRFVSIPAGFAKLFKGDHDWAFESEPQMSVGGRRVFTPRGKMLGGSSNLNAQIHQWCHPADFDGWESEGASGWGWDAIREVFRSQETWAGNDDEDARGREGPMHVSPNNNTLPLSRAFVEAARSCGLGDMPNFNGKAFQGAWLCELAHKNGKRFSAYDAYLKPAMSRSNLEVVTGAQVRKIEFENGRASGVNFIRNGIEQTISSQGVVLAAGTFGSPHILMHSGIGSGDVLSGLDIPVLVDSPDVGENLQDHPMVPMVFRSRNTPTYKSAETVGSLIRYILLKRGMLASNGVEAFAFSSIDNKASTAPDLELIFAPLEFRNQFLEPPQTDAFSIGVAVVSPRSRGRLIFRSPDPVSPPGIDLGLLNDPDGIDASVIWDGMRLARKIAATAPLSGLNSGELRPGVEVQSDDEFLGYAAQEIQTVYHPTGTCRMGTDERSVVDPHLKVKGVEGLWVADASVMPTVPRGHPNAVVAMIAERAAGWIDSATA